MGAQLSKVRGAFITRPRQRFNIEARAEKLLAKEEPKRAPRFDPDKEMLENIRQGNPEEIDVATKKDTDLLRKLEQVYVSSTDPNIFDPADSLATQARNPDRPLPKSGVRSSLTSGFSEANRLYPNTYLGKISIDELQNFLTSFADEPSANKMQSMAKQNK